MVASAFGILLKRLRDDRDLSLREVGQLANVDHAYIYRLETGEKESPSDEVINQLVRVLKPSGRDAEMLRFLSTHPEADTKLTEYVARDPEIGFHIYASAAGMRFRGGRRPEPKEPLERGPKFIVQKKHPV